VALAESLGLEPVVDAAGVPTVANPLALSATPATYRRRPPPLGADTTDVLDAIDEGDGP
jgi:crotonobetainyl-CoA:carnitine CoA-transferase CaiB-like acyl-CoA transferase